MGVLIQLRKDHLQRKIENTITHNVNLGDPEPHPDHLQLTPLILLMLTLVIYLQHLAWAQNYTHFLAHSTLIRWLSTPIVRITQANSGSLQGCPSLVPRPPQLAVLKLSLVSRPSHCPIFVCLLHQKLDGRKVWEARACKSVLEPGGLGMRLVTLTCIQGQ